jgi:hypothetical protein
VQQRCHGCHHLAPGYWEICRRCGAALQPIEAPPWTASPPPKGHEEPPEAPTELEPEAEAAAPPAAPAARPEPASGPTVPSAPAFRDATRPVEAAASTEAPVSDEDDDESADHQRGDDGRTSVGRLATPRVLVAAAVVVALLVGGVVIATRGDSGPREEIATYVDRETGVLYESSTGDFSVMMPGTVFPVHQDFPMNRGGLISVETASSLPVDQRGLYAMVAYIESPSAAEVQKRFVRERLDAALGVLPGAELGEPTFARYHGMRATDFEVSYEGGGGTARIAAQGNRGVFLFAIAEGEGGEAGFDRLAESLVLAG